MHKTEEIRSILQQSIDIPPEKHTMFFKTGAGEYGAHDRFLGVKVPTLRKIAKSFLQLEREHLEFLLKSPLNEERFFSLIILVDQYKRANTSQRQELYQFYLENLHGVNNWNLVDASAHLIVGAHLLDKDKEPLLTLSQSEDMWERRVAMVSTWYFIRHSQLEWTFKLSEILLNDRHDLIHKAVGWMLREAGKKDQAQLVLFLNKHAHKMPRTMLRYSIEKFDDVTRKMYLNRRVN